MLARHHAIAASLTWLLAAPAAISLAGGHLSSPEIAAGAVLAAGAGILPDMDKAGSSASGTAGLPGRLGLALVRPAFGGHRALTHSLVGVVAGSAVAVLAAAAGGWAEVALGAVLLAVALHVIGPARARAAPLATVSVLLASAWLLRQVLVSAPLWPGLLEAGHGTSGPGAWLGRAWLVWAVAIGMSSHLLTDALTHGGVPLLWPWKRRFGLALVRTGHIGESALDGLMAVGLGARAVWLVLHWR
ncbi:MAG: metal-dependent hydrolase [Acidimicrobiales bacterium]